MYQRYLNRLVGKEIERFLDREKTGSVEIFDGMVRKQLFQFLEEMKTVVGFLEQKGYEPFKRGTKEPARIKEFLDTAKWEEAKDAPKVGKSMWD